MNSKVGGTSETPRKEQNQSEDVNMDDADDVSMGENYNVETIENFLQQDTCKELIDITEDSVSPETKKNRKMDRNEGLAREVSPEWKNI